MFLCKVLINKYTVVLLGKMCYIQLPVQPLSHWNCKSMTEQENFFKPQFNVHLVNIQMQPHLVTRMHSSRMRTACFSGRLGGVCLGGVFLGGVCLEGVCLEGCQPEGVCLGGSAQEVHPPGSRGRHTPLHARIHTPSPAHCMQGYTPMDRRNDTHLWKYHFAPNFVCGR